ncbi:hypothetical protein niasHT_007648 [Heterodera trifolii]|uniref:Transmembrane protein n=1 Tax=Heterodera trifolii TaxID=157864 RepID=A0ABD2LPT2_9BILA
MSCASPSSHSSTISTTISATHLPVIENEQKQRQSMESRARSSRNNALTVRELAKGTPKTADDQRKADTVPPLSSYGNCPVAPSTPCCFSSSNSSPNFAGLGKRRSSWSNLMQSSEQCVSPPTSSNCSPFSPFFVRHAQFPSAPAAFGSRPPSYGEFVAQCQNIRHSHTTASRQTSDASTSGRRSGGTAAESKCAPSSVSLRFVGPPAPFPACAVRSASAQSSTSVGGRVSSSSSDPRRPFEQKNSAERKKKRDRMQELRDLWAKTGCKLCCLASLLSLIGLLVTVAILAETFAAPKRVDFAWLPPDQFRTGAQSNRVAMRVGELGEQVRFELTAAPPFKSNIVSVFDFKTNNVAHLDRSLRSASSARQSVCFVLPLDRQQTLGMDQLQRAAKAGAEKNAQLHGWEEDWHFMPNPVSAPAQLFQPDISECQGARWIELIRTPTDQKGQRCSECFDFCLPDWGIERDAIRDEKHLNVLRRICFHLFVPEWRTFAQSMSTQQNQQDFEEFYRQQQQQMANSAGQRVGAMPGGGKLETKWVTLQTPQTPPLANVSALFPSLSQSLWSGIGQFGQGVGQHLFGTSGGAPPMPSAGAQQKPFGSGDQNQQQNDNTAPQLTVHSQFSPSLLNGPPPSRQTQQQQFPPSLASLWNAWHSGGTPPVVDPSSVDGTSGGIGAVIGAQPQIVGGGQQQTNGGQIAQQTQQPTDQTQQQNVQQRSPSFAPELQQNQQQVWVGKR